MNRFGSTRIALVVFLIGGGSTNAGLVGATELSLSAAVEIALQRDSGITEYELRSTAAIEHGSARGELPDPRLRFAAMNFPVDTFKFDQEPMTMFSIGVSQMFPAGETRSLQKKIGNISGLALKYRADDRRHEVIKATRQNWFQMSYWQKTIQIYNADRDLFDQLLVITRSLFSVGKNQQQDVLRAELEISRLEERLLTATNALREAEAGLARWVGEEGMDIRIPDELEELPAVTIATSDLNSLAQTFAFHPMLRTYSQEVARSEKMIDLAEQAYKPSWNVDMSYGFRGGEDIDHSDRSDLASVMVNVSLPAFNNKRQDKSLVARKASAAGNQARYTTLLRDHTLKYQTTRAQWQQMHQRRKLFETSLLEQSKAQATAALNAYQSDASDFAEVMRAFLSDQQMQLDYEYLRIREQTLLAELHYLTAVTTIDTGFEQ